MVDFIIVHVIVNHTGILVRRKQEVGPSPHPC